MFVIGVKFSVLDSTDTASEFFTELLRPHGLSRVTTNNTSLTLFVPRQLRQMIGTIICRMDVLTCS